jgi:hypothetical protein
VRHGAEDVRVTVHDAVVEYAVRYVIHDGSGGSTSIRPR